MKELKTEIDIQASPAKVWQILMDFDTWQEWNPFIHTVVGKPEIGQNVDITVRTATSKNMTLHCTIIKIEPNRELCWKYHVIFPGLFRGEHSFIIESRDDGGAHFVDVEIFSGLFVPLQAKNIDTHSKRGFEEMDQALKTRAEQS
jgi:hypothetical protein